MVGYVNVSSHKVLTNFFDTFHNCLISEGDHQEDNSLLIVLDECLSEVDMSLSFCDSEDNSAESEAFVF